MKKLSQLPALHQPSASSAGSSASTSRFFAWIDAHPFLGLFSTAVILNLAVEMLARHSLVGGLKYLVSSPAFFLYNSLIVLMTLSVSQLFRKRNFFFLLVCGVWVGLGITNCVVLNYRVTPLCAVDFALLDSVAGVLKVYLSLFQMILSGALIAAGVVGLVILWRRTPRRMVRRRASFVTVALLTVAVVGTGSALQSTDDPAVTFGNIADAYEDYGFAYCFSTGLVEHGVNKPDDYSQESVAKILSDIGEDGSEDPSPAVKPNILFVQLESFMDLNRMNNLTFSEDPSPNFTALKQNYSHGLLTVSTVGAGTANTEFEVLSGLSLDYFGAGEYPYKTILQTTAAESTATDLEELGYSTHAIHDNTATFYDRKLVYSSFGFDSFTSLEYMNGVTYNSLGWAKDHALLTPIQDALNSSSGPDFIFTVSVQPHGKYPTANEDGAVYPITVSGCDSAEDTVAFSYYAQQVHETDAFVGDLIDQLSASDEPTIVVFYGDHLPTLNITDDTLKTGTTYDSEYVIWSNYTLPKQVKNLSAYQLSAYVLGRADIHNGTLTKLHQHSAALQNYEEDIHTLSYDMLYGDRYCYGGTSPYTFSDMSMGTKDITVSSAERSGSGGLLVRGQNFTQWSYVTLDGETCDTLYLSPELLLVSPSDLPDEWSEVSVSQLAASGSKALLSQSNVISSQS